MFPGYQGGEEYQPGQQPPMVRGDELQLGPRHQLVLAGGEYQHIYNLDYETQQVASTHVFCMLCSVQQP